MARKEFKLPDVGEGVAEGELVSWLVAPGDSVSEDQPVAEVETDKALVEVPSPYDGTVAELLAEPGEVVPVGNVIITFDVPDAAADDSSDVATDEEDVAASDDEKDVAASDDETTPEASGDETDDGAEPSKEMPDGRTFTPPSVRRLARELGVDIGAVSGSGPGGRVNGSDVRAHADRAGPTGSTDEPTPEPEPGSADRDGSQSAVRRRDEPSETDAGDTGATTESASPAATPQIETASREKTLAVPATRQVAREEGVDIDDVPTDRTRDGEAFVTAEQVREYADRLTGGPSATAVDPTPEAGADAGVSLAGPEPEETVPYRGVRRTIGSQMERSKFTAPHVSHHDTVEVTSLVDARKQLKPKAEQQGVKLTYMPFIIKAIIAGLKAHPELNSELRDADGDGENAEIALKKYYNIGIAVATDAGLMVPVIEHADRKGVFELAAEVNDLASRARNRKLTREEMQGGTFTITNFGAIGGEYASPIINYPETAILGLGAIEKRPVVKSSSELDGFWDDEEETHEVVARETLPLSLSIDHRVIDGAVAAQFTNTVMQHLENPLLLLAE